MKHIVTKAIKNEKQKYYKSLIGKTNNNTQLIINRSKTQQSNCTLPNNILGKHPLW